MKKCEHPTVKMWEEVSDVYSHSLRTCDAISSKYPLLRFAALLHDIGKFPTRIEDHGEVHFYAHESVGADMAEVICQRLQFSSDDMNYVKTVIANHMQFIDDETKLKTIKKWMARNPFYRDNLRLRIADRRGNLAKLGKPVITQKLKLLIKLVRTVEKAKSPISVKDLAINGYDLINLGFKPSPLFKVILTSLLEEVLEDETKNNKDYLLQQTLNLFSGELNK